MKLYGIDNSNPRRRAVALGTFDGVHKGHQLLLKRTVHRAQEENLSSTAFTFSCPPEQYFAYKTILLTDFDTKQRLIIEQGIEKVVWVDFNQDFVKISPEDFVAKILVEKLKAKIVVCGRNYHFGFQARGNVRLLQTLGKEYDFEVMVIEPLFYCNTLISSTRIRSALLEGDINLASQLLGRYPSYFGKIVSGKQIGRSLGFPTANLQITENLVLPKPGVYMSWCYLDQGNSYPAMTAIGSKPTIADKQTSIESYLLGFTGTLYGKSMEIQFLNRIRDTQKFESLTKLRQQLNKDKAYVQGLLSQYRLQDRRIVLE